MQNINRPIGTVSELRKAQTFCNAIGISHAIEVPVRKRGMTSSGYPNQCHSNTSLLVKKFGGCVVTGFLRIMSNGYLMLLCHSVWKTPEGKMVDVTLGRSKLDKICFLPVAEYDSNTHYYATSFNVVFPATGGGVFFVEHISSFLDGREKGVWVSKANLKRQGKSNLRSKLFERVSGEFPDEECGGFVEPSIASGKTFDKIWEEHSQKVE